MPDGLMTTPSDRPVKTYAKTGNILRERDVRSLIPQAERIRLPSDGLSHEFSSNRNCAIATTTLG